MIESSQRRLTREERQIQTLLRSVVEQPQIASLDGLEEIQTAVELDPLTLEVTVTSEHAEVAVLESSSRELFAFARYNRSDDRLLYTLRFHIVEDSLRRLVMTE